MLLGRDLRQQAGGNKVSVSRAGITAPRQMRTAIRGIIHSNNNLAWQRSLNPQVPLVDVSILRFRGSQIIPIGVTPFRQVAILLVLWAGVGANPASAN